MTDDALDAGALDGGASPGGADALPDVFVLGDSHAIALRDGCAAQGLAVDMLSFSGNLWHAGYVTFRPNYGVSLRGRVQRDRLDAVRARYGRDGVIRPDLPLIVSVGFHVGRLVPPFAVRGHVCDATGFAADEDALFVSAGFLETYIRHHRDAQLFFLRQIARRAPVVVVAPPPVYRSAVHAAFVAVIGRLIRAAGIALYDPRDDFAHLGPSLPADYLAPDGVHGNARYGAEVVGALVARGLIPGRRAG
jgi:hypothetical protein